MAEESIVWKVVVGAGQGLLFGAVVIVGTALVFAPGLGWMIYANEHFQFWWGIVLGIGGMVLWGGLCSGVVAKLAPSTMLFGPMPPPPLPPYYRITTGEKD